MERGQLLTRHSPPNKYDHAPKGTRCSVVENYKVSAIYEQTSEDEENPRWQLLSESGVVNQFFLQ